MRCAAAMRPANATPCRRKFRKMRIRFDNAMQQSNSLIMDEWKAMGVARRLQAENDQLLDALLDFNNQPRVPARQRFDLADPSSTVRPASCPDIHRTPDQTSTAQTCTVLTQSRRRPQLSI